MRGLRTFCIVARHGSFRMAAEDLFLTPSAISHQIKSMEEELDVRLFDRSARDLRLTEAGHNLFNSCNDLIAQLDEVAGDFLSRYRQRPLRVTVQPFFATEMLVPRLSSFIDKNPGITIDIENLDQSVEKHPAQSDVSIRLFRKPPRNLVSHELFRLRLVPACSPGFLQRQPGISQASLGGLPRIVHSKRRNAWRDWTLAAGIELAKQPGAIILESMISVARAAEQGLGIALVPLPLSEAWFTEGKLVRLSDCELSTPDRYFLVARKEDAQREEVDAFSQWTLQEFGQGA